jgi:hypothetical protein
MKMDNIGMLDHQKMILENLTENRDMFVKELRKSRQWLSVEESGKLYLWLRENYWDSYKREIEMVFKIVA